MSFILTVLLGAAVWVLWARVNSLQRKLDQIERAQDVPRGQPADSAPFAPSSGWRPVTQEAGAPAAAPAPQVAAAGRLRAAELPGAKRAPAPPASSALQDSPLFRLVRDFFSGGNVVVRVGIIVLFFGVGFLLKYAADHSLISAQLRLSAVAASAVVLFVLGWRLRDRRRGYALALQGGAIGLLYLTLFAALKLYQLASPGWTFVLMAVLGIALSWLAVRQDSLALSLLGATGGYLAPVLASTGDGNHVLLFSYYALLTLGVAAQAWFKAWRPLNLLAFGFVFGVGTVWGVLRYEPAQFASTEPFLLFFLLVFIAIAVLFAFRQAPQLTHYVDGTLVFGTPVVAMSLQMALVRDIPHGRFASALGAGLLYLALAAWLHRTRRDSLRLLMESFLAIGVAFVTLAVPLLLDDAWTAATWALEGAALVWVGLRQHSRLSAASGVLLQVAAAVAYAIAQAGSAAPLTPLANAPFMGAVLLAAAGLFSARLATRTDPMLQPFGQTPANLLLTWGMGWWLYAGFSELQHFVPAQWMPGAMLGVCVFTALAAGVLARRLAWPAMRVPALLLLPFMVLLALNWWSGGIASPSRAGGWLAWPAAFVVWWLTLRWHESSLPRQVAAVLHGGALWLLALLAGWEASWQVAQVSPSGSAWADAAWALPSVVLLALLTGRRVDTRWPLRDYPYDLRGWVAAGLAAMLGLWSLWLDLASSGAATPLPYLPVLNPLDVVTMLALFVVARWLSGAGRSTRQPFDAEIRAWMTGALVLISFAWLNAVLLRTIHHWHGVPYEFDALLRDTFVQTSLSIFWTLLALAAMLRANRNQQRIVWFGGAALMAVVVAKLFFVDLARVGTVPRIVSFLVVGGLMLVIGYFSPLPPAKADDDEAADTKTPPAV